MEDINNSDFIIKVWRNINISTLLFLKLFENEIKPPYSSAKTVNKESLFYPIHYICYEYGLIKCYLDRDKTKLHLLFDKSVCRSDYGLINSQYYNYLNRLIDSKHFHSIFTTKQINKTNIIDTGITRIVLNIPSKFHSDIRLIINQSSYSLVSDNFKKNMLLYDHNIPVFNNSLTKYIVTKNIPYKIVNKIESLKDEIKKALTVITPVQDFDAEYFVKFNETKEYWDNDKYKLYE